MLRIHFVQHGFNLANSKIDARVEQGFAVVKRLWGFTKVRYRGLAKNANRAFVALALTNVYLLRKRLRHRFARNGGKRAAGPGATPWWTGNPGAKPHSR